MKDRRQNQRWPSYLGASINFNRRTAVASCIVKNTSPAGAKLVLHNPVFVPEEFDLVVPHKRAECRMRTRWRRHEFVGVEILYVYPRDEHAFLADARTIHRLREENASLRRQMGLDVA